MANPLIERLKRGEVCVNGWLLAPDSYVAEIMAQTGWDSLTIDLQHGLHDYRSAVESLQALHGRGPVPLARVPWNEPGIIGKILDAGAWGIICPMVNNAEQARALVDACLYAPQGARSNGPVRAGFYGTESPYQGIANANVLVLPQIETVEAVENLEAILDVPGISGAYVGPSDLGLAMGLAPVLDRQEPEILAIYDRVIAAVRARNLIAGIQNGTAAYAAEMAAKGFQIVTVATDVNLMGMAAFQAVTTTRSLIKQSASADAATA
ncbi:4-hydroxy-2-oxoheptanedioate aldolase [Novosphingobium capsulatum]|uniref:4-hydroxy-2-oxoheptanedioate aldolase n=1 Tax=Novosphingobium capsulatum TaxID=13688 RepID=A0ABU1MLQ1_9SPHN|nr:aldolase/citrate lyase family protein [Novosphingobium capsulatum]MDR6510962.1 4-hydroxy-2-oxoheptanedioate aldolase [Novosphingobium capsulatum]